MHLKCFTRLPCVLLLLLLQVIKFLQMERAVVAAVPGASQAMQQQQRDTSATAQHPEMQQQQQLKQCSTPSSPTTSEAGSTPDITSTSCEQEPHAIGWLGGSGSNISHAGVTAAAAGEDVDGDGCVVSDECTLLPSQAAGVPMAAAAAATAAEAALPGGSAAQQQQVPAAAAAPAPVVHMHQYSVVWHEIYRVPVLYLRGFQSGMPQKHCGPCPAAPMRTMPCPEVTLQ